MLSLKKPGEQSITLLGITLGHGTRDVVKEIGQGTRDAANTAGEPDDTNHESPTATYRSFVLPKR